MPSVTKDIHLVPFRECTGCAACAASCKVGAICLSDEGHLHSYPRIDTQQCIQCARCMKTCPVLNRVDKSQNEFEQHYYCSWSKDDSVRARGTSGGLATLLAKTAIRQGYIVCGASFDHGWRLIHKIAQSEEQINVFSGSKYLQSEVLPSLQQIAFCLAEHKRIFFIGTPCQTDAVRSLFNPQYEKQLITCEIICHGVNSPRVWRDYVEFLQQKHHSVLTNYCFRSKSRGWQKPKGGPNLRVSYTFANGKHIDAPAWQNLFHYWFGQHLMLRPSCLSCTYRREQRDSDITIGDFWGVQRVIPDILSDHLKKGVSVAVTSTMKGNEFLKTCSGIYLREVDAAKTKGVLRGFIENKPYFERKKEIQNMLEFESKYLEHGIDKMRKQHPVQTPMSRFIQAVKYKLHMR